MTDKKIQEITTNRENKYITLKFTSRIICNSAPLWQPYFYTSLTVKFFTYRISYLHITLLRRNIYFISCEYRSATIHETFNAEIANKLWWNFRRSAILHFPCNVDYITFNEFKEILQKCSIILVTVWLKFITLIVVIFMSTD